MKKILLLLAMIASTATWSQPTLGKRKRTNAGEQKVDEANRVTRANQVNSTPTESRMRLKLPLTSTEREFTVQKIGHLFILNGDIIVGNDIPKTLSYSVRNEGYLWENATIPLVIDNSIYMNNLGGVVHEAIREFNENTRLCIVPRTYQQNYVRVSFSSEIRGAGASPVGRQGGEQALLLAGSATKGNMMHELMHAAGFYHEQGREDRDEFIQIFLENVAEGAKNNFQKEGGTIRGGYDFCSLMHYPGFAFATDPSKPTIICIKNIETCRNCIGQREKLTGADLAGIDQLYSVAGRMPCKTQFPNPNIPQQFASVSISESDKAMQSFRHRADYASQNGFAAGFPNFHEARQGNNLVGGTILIKHGMIAWQDVSLQALRNPNMADFAARMRATQDYAVRNGFIAGFPNYHSANVGGTTVCGTFLLTNAAAEWRDVPLSELGNPPLNDIGARMRSANDYAFRNGFLGGFPTFYHADYGNGTVCGIVLIKKDAGEWRDVVIAAGPR